MSCSTAQTGGSPLGLQQSAQSSANPFGFSEFEPLASSMAAQPSEAADSQPAGFPLPAEVGFWNPISGQAGTYQHIMRTYV